MNKIMLWLLCLALLSLTVVPPLGQAETIYTKAGQTIQAKISEVDQETVWYEASNGEVIEYNGIDKAEIEQILKDDGSVFDFSVTKVMEAGSDE